MRRLLVVLADPPLDPSPDEARSKLRGELLNPEYHQQNLIVRLLDWIGRQLDGLVDATSRAPGVSTLLAMLVLVALVLLLGLLISRARRTARAKEERRAVLTDEVVTAGELRERAEAALAADRHEDAVVDGFRALTVRQVERGRLADAPGATAHEVSVSLAGEYPDQRTRLDGAAALFEQVLYGDRSADRAQAMSVLALDDELSGRRGALR